MLIKGTSIKRFGKLESIVAWFTESTELETTELETIVAWFLCQRLVKSLSVDFVI